MDHEIDYGKQNRIATARHIIQRNTNYTDAYYEMIDEGYTSEEADKFWNQFKNYCGKET